MSTNFQVVKIQDDLAAAQTLRAAGPAFYRQAVATYRVAVGDLLEAMGITVKGEKEPREPHTALKDVGWLKYGRYAKPDGAAAAKH